MLLFLKRDWCEKLLLHKHTIKNALCFVKSWHLIVTAEISAVFSKKAGFVCQLNTCSYFLKNYALWCFSYIPLL